MLCPWAMSFFQKLGPSPFTAIPCSFPEPVLGPQCCLYNLLEGQLENSRPLGEKYCNDIQSFLRFRPSSSIFPTTCSTTAPLSELAREGDRHAIPARSPSVGGIPSRAIQLPGIMFATLGVSPAGHLGLNPYHPSPKITTQPWIKSPLHFYATSGLLPLINLFLSQLLTPTTRTLPPCRQHCSTPLIRIL